MAEPNGFKGTVTSGTGATYTCNITGVGSATVNILQIDSGETIPAGTPLIIVKIGGSYYAQVPVWADEP